MPSYDGSRRLVLYKQSFPNGFDVVSVICKNGAQPKSSIGLTDTDTLSGCANEVMCNPIGQASTDKIQSHRCPRTASVRGHFLS